MKRFATFTNEEIGENRRNVVPKNTQKAEQAAERLFTEFLKEQSIRDMNKLSDNELDIQLAKFWFSVRTQKGDYYRVSSLENCMYNLNRIFKRNGRVDIIKSEVFRKSQVL